MTVLNFPLNLEWFKKKNQKKQSESFCVQFPLQPHEGKRKKQKHKGTIYLSYCAWNEKPNTVVLPEDASAPRKEIRAPLWNFTKRCWQFYLFKKKKNNLLLFCVCQHCGVEIYWCSQNQREELHGIRLPPLGRSEQYENADGFYADPRPGFFITSPARSRTFPACTSFCGLCARQQNKRQGRPVLSLCTGTEIWKKKKCRLSECCLNGP